MKTVFSSHEIAHAWYHSHAPHGRCSANMSFQDDVFLSYNTAIARKISHKGKAAVIINSRTFSVSTTRHQGVCRRAIPDSVTRFYFQDGMGSRLCVNGKGLFDYAIRNAMEALTDSRLPRIRQATRDGHLATRQHWLAEAQRVSDFFGLRRKVDDKVDERLAKRIAAAERAEAKRQAAKIKAAQEAAQEDLAAWLAGGRVDGYTYKLGAFPVYLRRMGDTVETSKGATVTLAEAKLAYRFLLRNRATGWHRNGEQYPIGKYQLDAINEQGIVVGCHRIAWGEIERFAAVMGWAKELPAHW